jgi:hypothetical protein
MAARSSLRCACRLLLMQRSESARPEGSPMLIVACRLITSGDKGVSFDSSSVSKFCTGQRVGRSGQGLEAGGDVAGDLAAVAPVPAAAASLSTSLRPR